MLQFANFGEQRTTTLNKIFFPMNKHFFKCIFVLFLILPFSAKPQSRDYWIELENSLKSGQFNEIEKATKNIVTEEGLELRVLLSLLYSNGIPLSGKETGSLIANYNNLKSTFLNSRHHLFQIDSIYTETYIFYRNEKILKEEELKPYEKISLIKFNDRIKAKHKIINSHYNYYDYLKGWLLNSERSEDEIIIDFLREKGITINSLLSYEQLSSKISSSTKSISQFDLFKQKLLTYYRSKVKENESKGLYELALNYVDSIALRFPDLYSSDFENAKRLAMKHKLKSYYLHFLTMDRGSRIMVSNYKDTMPTYGRTKEDTNFVKSVLKTYEFNDKLLTEPLPLLNYDLYLLSNRFAELHNFGSKISYPKNKIGYLVENKGRKQNLYLGYVKESYYLYPHSIQFLVRTANDWNSDINANFSYINLHLLQYNANGQRVDDSIFTLFKSTNEHLVKLGLYDLEDYYWTEDYFTTAVKHKPSNYGWQMGKGNFSEKVVINRTTIENRKKKFLLPFNLLKN